MEERPPTIRLLAESRWFCVFSLPQNNAYHVEQPMQYGDRVLAPRRPPGPAGGMVRCATATAPQAVLTLEALCCCAVCANLPTLRCSRPAAHRRRASPTGTTRSKTCTSSSSSSRKTHTSTTSSSSSSSSSSSRASGTSSRKTVTRTVRPWPRRTRQRCTCERSEPHPYQGVEGWPRDCCAVRSGSAVPTRVGCGGRESSL